MCEQSVRPLQPPGSDSHEIQISESAVSEGRGEADGKDSDQQLAAGLDDPVRDTCIPTSVTAGYEEEIRIEDEDTEEAAAPKIVPDPGQPTKEQLEQHRVTHNPFRSWCRWCVAGRARGLKHPRERH